MEPRNLPAPRPRQTDLQEAIDAPAWHSGAFPDLVLASHRTAGVLVVENRVPKATIDTLKGAACRRGRPRLVGSRLHRGFQGCRRRRAAANPRGMQGYAAGR